MRTMSDTVRPNSASTSLASSFSFSSIRARTKAVEAMANLLRHKVAQLSNKVNLISAKQGNMIRVRRRLSVTFDEAKVGSIVRAMPRFRAIMARAFYCPSLAMRLPSLARSKRVAEFADDAHQVGCAI